MYKYILPYIWLTNKKFFNPVILQAQHFLCRNAFEVIVQTRVGGGLSPIFKHREELKIQGEAEYFLTSFEVFWNRMKSSLRVSDNQLLYGFHLCLDGLIQTRGKVARVKKSARNTSRRRVILHAFLNSSNISKCLDQAILKRKS